MVESLSSLESSGASQQPDLSGLQDDNAVLAGVRPGVDNSEQFSTPVGGDKSALKSFFGSLRSAGKALGERIVSMLKYQGNPLQEEDYNPLPDDNRGTKIYKRMNKLGNYTERVNNGTVKPKVKKMKPKKGGDDDRVDSAEPSWGKKLYEQLRKAGNYTATVEGRGKAAKVSVSNAEDKDSLSAFPRYDKGATAKPDKGQFRQARPERQPVDMAMGSQEVEQDLQRKIAMLRPGTRRAVYSDNNDRSFSDLQKDEPHSSASGATDDN